jgi:hypothetical protein
MLPTLLLVHGGACVLALGVLWWRERGVAFGKRPRTAAA